MFHLFSQPISEHFFIIFVPSIQIVSPFLKEPRQSLSGPSVKSIVIY